VDIQQDLAYTAGLLHDLGKIIISEFLERSNNDLRELLKLGKTDDFREVERSILGTDHTQIGEEMAKKWGLPEPLKAVIRYHHDPGNAPAQHRELTEVVHAGNVITFLTGFGIGVETLVSRFDPYVEEVFNFNQETMANLISQIDEEYLEIVKKFRDTGYTV
jgi:putative nucleotidyltransferase with HDIG domain